MSRVFLVGRLMVREMIEDLVESDTEIDVVGSVDVQQAREFRGVLAAR